MKIRLLFILCIISSYFAQNVVSQTADNNLENAKKPVIPSGRTVLADMKANNPVMYSQYLSARKKQRTGIIMTGAGGGVFVIGAIFSVIPDTEQGNASVSVFGINLTCRFFHPKTAKTAKIC